MCGFVSLFLALVRFREKKNIRVSEAIFKELTQLYKIIFKRGNRTERKNHTGSIYVTFYTVSFVAS